MLRRALADFAGGDQQQLIHACQRGGEGGLVGVIGLADIYALLAQRFGFRRVTHNSNQLTGRNGFQQQLNDVLAKLAGGTGNRDHDEYPSSQVSVVAHYHLS
ncbi:hypothetical protein D3C75_1131750 [compost metagenome]